MDQKTESEMAVDPELYQAQVTMLFNSLENAFRGLRDLKESSKNKN